MVVWSIRENYGAEGGGCEARVTGRVAENFGKMIEKVPEQMKSASQRAHSRTRMTPYTDDQCQFKKVCMGNIILHHRFQQKMLFKFGVLPQD